MESRFWNVIDSDGIFCPVLKGVLNQMIAMFYNIEHGITNEMEHMEEDSKLFEGSHDIKIPFEYSWRYINWFVVRETDDLLDEYSNHFYVGNSCCPFPANEQNTNIIKVLIVCSCSWCWRLAEVSWYQIRSDRFIAPLNLLFEWHQASIRIHY